MFVLSSIGHSDADDQQEVYHVPNLAIGGGLDSLWQRVILVVADLQNDL